MAQKIPVVLADDQASHYPLSQEDQIVASAVPLSPAEDNALIISEDGGLYVPPGGGASLSVSQDAGNMVILGSDGGIFVGISKDARNQARLGSDLGVYVPPPVTWGACEYNSGESTVDPSTAAEITFGDGSFLPDGWEVSAGRINLPVPYTDPVRVMATFSIVYAINLDETAASQLDLVLTRRPIFHLKSNDVLLASFTSGILQMTDTYYVERFTVDITDYAMLANDAASGLYQSLELYINNLYEQWSCGIVSATCRIAVEQAIGNWRNPIQ